MNIWPWSPSVMVSTSASFYEELKVAQACGRFYAMKYSNSYAYVLLPGGKIQGCPGFHWLPLAPVMEEFYNRATEESP